MFSEAKTPTIARRAAGAGAAVAGPKTKQVTSDLIAFWQGSYREVQKEMKGLSQTCPRDDPANCANAARQKYSCNETVGRIWGVMPHPAKRAVIIERFLPSQDGRTENRGPAPECCGEKAWRE